MKAHELTAGQRATIKRLISKTPYSQRDLCKVMGISSASLSRVLNGTQRCSWTDEQWGKLAASFNLSYDGLLKQLGMKKTPGSIGFVHENDSDALMIPFCAFDFGGPGEDGMDTIVSDRLVVVPRVLIRAPENKNILISVNDAGLKPEICLDDYVIVDTEDRQIVDGGIYAVCDDRRIHIRKAAAPQRGTVKLYSNDRTMYVDIDLPVDNTEAILGRAASVMRRLF